MKSRPDGMSVLLENSSLKDKVANLQKKVVKLESELRRVQTRLRALEGKRGVPRQPAFAPDGQVVGEGEDVQCVVC